MKSYILLENVKFYAFHGVFTQETRVGNNFVINIKLQVDIQKPSKSDNLDETLSYASVYNVIKEQMSIPSKLLEHVGGRIVREIRKKFDEVKLIELKISKLNPPIGGQVEAASIIIIDQK